jgi:glycosyltransferase involved in cell wall biosynthesis
MAKILVVSQHYWPEDFRLNDLTDILVENKHEVTVLTGQPNYPQGVPFSGYKWWKFSSEYHKGIKIYRVPLWPRHSGNALNLIINYFSFMFFTLLASPFFLFKQFDHVIAWGTSPIFQGLSGAFIAFVKRIPMTVWVLDLWPESLSATNTVKNKAVLNFVLIFVKMFYAMCDNILCTSASFVEHIKKQGVNHQKLKYFPNWAEEIYTDETTTKEELFNFPEGTIITYAGNLGVAQDIENIFQCLKILKNEKHIHFLILGDGRQKDWLISQIKNENLTNTHILGRFPAESMPYFFNRSDAFLVTLKDEDIFSKTLPGRVMSFMAAGKPIIAAASGETEKILIQSHSGLCVAPGSPEALAEAIKKIATLSENEKHQLGANAKNYFYTHFYRRNVYDRFKNLVNL